MAPNASNLPGLSGLSDLSGPSDSADAADTVVLIPIRSFDDAKSRLAGALSVEDRRQLARAMAEVVVRAALGLPVWIVTENAEVTEWAPTVDALAVAVDRTGLTSSVSTATQVASDHGFARAIIAHSDLPYAVDLTIVDGPGLAIAPDRRRDGSNVLSVPTGAGFRFAYGPGSFHAHLAEADRLGLSVDVVDIPGLAWDVDDPDDLPADWAELIARNRTRAGKTRASQSSQPGEADHGAS